MTAVVHRIVGYIAFGHLQDGLGALNEQCYKLDGQMTTVVHRIVGYIAFGRSEERRVALECRSQRSPYH